MQDRNAALAAQDALARVPVSDRMAALIFSIVEGNNGRSCNAICAMVAVASAMASYMTPADRAVIAEQLRFEADGLCGFVH